MNYSELLNKVNGLYKSVDESFIGAEYEKLTLYNYLKEYNNFTNLIMEHRLIITEVIYNGLLNKNEVNRLFIDKNISNKNNTDSHVLISLFHYFISNEIYKNYSNAKKINYLLNVFILLKSYRYKKCKEINIRNKNTIVYNNMLIRYSNNIINSNRFAEDYNLYYSILENNDEEKQQEFKEETKEIDFINCKICGEKNKIYEIDNEKFYECVKCKNCDLCI